MRTGRPRLEPKAHADFAWLKARERDRNQLRRERIRAQREREHAAKVAPRLELLGADPPAEWLASVGVSQARLRTAEACLDSALAALQQAITGCDRRAVRRAQAAIHACKPLVSALQPVTLCPYCRASQPDCQPCSGRGVLTLTEASELPPDLLHDD